MAPTGLARLFGDPAVFADHSRRGRWHLRRTSGFSDLFGIAEADRLVGAGVLQVPFDARMTNALHEAGATTAERWREAMRSHSPERFDPDAAIAGFDQGDTIILHALQQRVPALDALAHDLQAEIGQTVEVNAFLTPPHAQGLEPHYDHHDVIILQVHGAKTWRLWEPTVTHPLPEYSPHQFDVHGDPDVVTLEEGDVLYVPRGWTHAATTTGVTSLHLTVGIIPVPLLEIAHGFLASLDREEDLRRSLPLGYHRDVASVVPGIEAMVTLVRTMLATRDIELAAKELAASFTPRRATRTGRLAEVIAAGAPLDGTTRLARGSRAPDRLRQEHGGWVELEQVVAALPAHVAQGLGRLAEGETMTLDDLFGSAGEGAIRFARQLLRHGLLSLAETGGPR